MSRRNRSRNLSPSRESLAAGAESTTNDATDEETAEAETPEETAAEAATPTAEAAAAATDTTISAPAAIQPATLAETLPPRPVWRTIAIAKQARQVYFGGVLTPILGGELIEFPPHVAALRGDSAFEFIDVASPEALDGIRERHDRAIAALRDLARKLGFVVYRDGEIPRSK
jgi:hypothetical protein